MTKLTKLFAATLIVFTGSLSVAIADDDKDESGHGKKRGGGSHSFKEE